jgi:ribokinase
VTGSPDPPSVIVVGSLNRDYVCTVDILPERGETRLGTELTLWCGGKGGNQAVAAALMGAGVRVAMVGAVGDDEDGTALIAGLRAEDGDNTIVVAPGANRTVEAPDACAVIRRRKPAVVVVQGELPPAVAGAALQEAAGLGARPMLNLAPVIPVPGPVLRLCDPLIVNAVEAGALLGRALVDPADLASAAQELSRRARSVVVTGGARGAWTAEDGEVRHIPARPTAVVDTTGAGDAFTGALAVGLALGEGLVEAAGWGTVVAAHAVGRPGAQASFPRGIDIGFGQSGPIP